METARGGEGTPTCAWPMHMHAGVVCYLNKQRTSLTWHVPHKPHTRAGTSRTGCVRPRDRVFGGRSRDRTGLDLVCHLAMTCTNTEKQLFTVDYTLSVPNNALDHRGHRMGARYGDRPRGGGHPYMRVAHAYACRGGVLFE